MRNAILTSGLLLVGYIVCSASCGGTTGSIPDGGSGSGGGAGSGGSGGVAGSAGAAGTAGSAGSGGSAGSAGSGGSAGVGGASGTSGSGGTAGEGGLKDAPSDSPADGATCSGLEEAGAGVGIPPGMCEMCIGTNCCAEVKTCEANAGCAKIESCTLKCIKSMGLASASKCSKTCNAEVDSGTSQSDASKLNSCLESNCITACESSL